MSSLLKLKDNFKNENTALHLVCIEPNLNENNKLVIILDLLMRGAMPHEKNTGGQTFLDLSLIHI